MEKRHSSSLAARSFMAILLLVGFYALALAVVAFLLFGVFAMVYSAILSPYAIFICLVGSGIIIWAIFPRIDRFIPPGPRLKPEKHPLLFKELKAVADATEQSMPVEVYLTPDVNAFVAQRGGMMGVGSRRVMGIGLPLLQVLSIAQLRSVLAHEFGHFYGGDTRFSPIVYKTRGAVLRTANALRGHRLLQLPFRKYAEMYLRITQSISREQELSADRLAARLFGPSNMKDALKNLRRNTPAWDTYMNDELFLPFKVGYLPPVSQGFGSFVDSEIVVKQIEDFLARETLNTSGDPLDSHPTLSQRQSAIDELKAVERPDDGRLAIGLLDDVIKYELELFQPIAKRLKVKDLKQVSWDDIVGKVYIPYWQNIVDHQKVALSGLNPEFISRIVKNPDLLTSKLRKADAQEGFPIGSLMRQTVGAGLANVLVNLGWSVEAVLGKAVVMSKNGKSIEPFGIFEQLMSGKMTGDEWLATCRECGIEGANMGYIPA